MPLVASLMEPKPYSHATHSARKSPGAFKPSPANPWAAAAGSPASSSMGSMNYSPRHSCKPSSLLNSRNINIQRLLLDTDSPLQASTIQLPRRGKPLAIFIPPDASPLALAHKDLKTPTREALLSCDSGGPMLLALPPSNGRSRFLGSACDEIETHSAIGLDLEKTNTKLRSPLNLNYNPPSGILNKANSGSLCPDMKSDNGRSITHGPTGNIDRKSDRERIDVLDHQARLSSGISVILAMPEELQESGLTHAYPQGPANVLNSVIYLYSDPETSKVPVDINDYDLVVNVARECGDLTSAFDDRNGTRKYLRVPWSHTSTILKELPMITREIAAMDKPGRKILVHCQCGVLRSACVVVAYFMVKFKITVNEAYELLKSGSESTAEEFSRRLKEEGHTVEACERICPNMSLIFELMDFGDRLLKDS